MQDSNEVLLSVKPQYANLLVDGIKTVELRRRFPADLKEGTRCLIYSSSPVQMVIGECKIGKVEHLSIEDLWKSKALEAMIPWSDLERYFAGIDFGYAVNMYGHIRYQNAKSLTSVLGAEGKAPQSYRYLPSRAPEM